jgi:high-affinity iron transporter
MIFIIGDVLFTVEKSEGALLKKFGFLLFSFFFLPALFGLGVPTGALAEEWDSVVERVETTLVEAVLAYEEGRSGNAKSFVSEAYFDHFEGEGMETAVSVHISEGRKSELEGMFGAVRGAISKNAPLEDVKEKTSLLVSALREDSKRLSTPTGRDGEGKPSPYALFLNSLIIILREGFEAILVISAISAYLVKTGNKEKVKTVYGGAAIALVASVATAILLQTVIRISGAGREALEGIVMLFATGVLFYVSYWLITKIEVARWQRYIRSKVEGSLGKRSLLTLSFAAFLAVYREGAETILFYQALYSGSGGHAGPIIAGLGLGALLLVGLFFLIKHGSMVIPIAPFFAVTSTFLYYLAFTFAGKGIRELQEAQWLSTSYIEGFPTLDFVGLYPTWEGIFIQAFLVLALLTALVYSFLLKPYRERAAVTGDITHIESDIKSIHDMLEDVSQHARKCQGLTQGVAGHETGEISRHLVALDAMVHEVSRHLKKLERGIQDIFSELEGEIKRYRG